MKTAFPIRIYLLFFIAVFALLGLSLFLMPSTMTPLLTGLILAYAFDPVIDYLERRGFSRSKAVFWFFIFMGFFMAAALLLLLPTLLLQLSELIESSPQLLVQFLNWISQKMHMETSLIKQKILEFVSTQYSAENVARIAKIIKTSFSSTAGALTLLGTMLMIPIFFYFFLMDIDRIKQGFFKMIPRPWQSWVQIRLKKMDSILSGFIRGQLLVASLLSLFYSTGLVLLGVRYGLLIGVGAGLLNIIPYVGVTSGLLLSLAMGFFSQSPVFQISGILILFLGIQLLEGFYLTPRIVGNKVGLTPFFAIISLLVGGELFGLSGMVAAIPAAGVLRVILRDVKAAYLRSRLYLKAET